MSGAVPGEGRLRLAIADGHDHRELAIFGELRAALVPLLLARLRDVGHAVERLDLPADARPFPGARFDCLAETATGERLTIRCELRPRRWNGARVGSVDYRVVGGG